MVMQMKGGAYLWDTGSKHSPLTMLISLGCASGNKPGPGVIETAYIPHNHTLTVKCR